MKYKYSLFQIFVTSHTFYQLILRITSNVYKSILLLISLYLQFGTELDIILYVNFRKFLYPVATLYFLLVYTYIAICC